MASKSFALKVLKLCDTGVVIFMIKSKTTKLTSEISNKAAEIHNAIQEWNTSVLISAPRRKAISSLVTAIPGMVLQPVDFSYELLRGHHA